MRDSVTHQQPRSHHHGKCIFQDLCVLGNTNAAARRVNMHHVHGSCVPIHYVPVQRVEKVPARSDIFMEAIQEAQAARFGQKPHVETRWIAENLDTNTK